MPRTKLAIIAVLVVHSIFTFQSWVEHGYSGFFPPFVSSNTTQIFGDLLISISLVNVWIYFDLKKHQQKTGWFLVILFGTMASGSYAPLLYLLFRDRLITPKAKESVKS